MKKIVIGGMNYPCTMTMGAMLRFKRRTNKEVQQLNPNDIEEFLELIHACVVSGCKAEGVAFDLSLDEMADGLTVEEMTCFSEEMFGAPKSGEESKKK